MIPGVTRKIGFVLASTDHGTMILNRFDYRMTGPSQGFGVGLQILEGSSFERPEVNLALVMLDLRRKYFGDGVVAVDCGANIGPHTIEWAKTATGWGSVIAIEAQERVFYALAGNIAINNCFNARAIHAAVSTECGTMKIPNPDYLAAGSFGSLELKQRSNTEFIGQAIDYSAEKLTEIPAISLDSLHLARLDFIKIDVEGMELDVLDGAAESVSRCRPAMLVEAIKTDKVKLRSWLTDRGYRVFEAGINVLAIHNSDQSAMHFKEAS